MLRKESKPLARTNGRSRRPTVVYWNNMPAPYMVERFNALADRGAFDFEAWFNVRSASDRSWIVDERTWRFKYAYLPGVNVGQRRFVIPLRLLARHPPDALVSLYAEPSFVVGWAIARLRRVAHALWVEVTFSSWVRRRWWKEALKRHLFERVSGIITAGNDGFTYARKYHARENRIFFARHTIDVQHFSTGRVAALPERERLRAELGLRGVTFLYVGRLWWGKGLNFLLDAFSQVQKRLPEKEVSLLLLGDGQEEDELRAQCARTGARNVVFGGFKHKPELPRFYAAADIFVFPTLGDPYGLVVDEAMASSLPIITTADAGEIRERVEDGINGYIVPARNANALAEKMERIARLNPDERARMGYNSFAKVRNHTPEVWARDFEQAIEQILAEQKCK